MRMSFCMCFRSDQGLDYFPSITGQSLLDRRSFLSRAASGLGGIALVHLLSQQRLLAADRPAPIVPKILSEAPVAARPAHFTPKAKQVLLIFCSGGCSHLDTFDYKPELVRRDGQAMPGASNLITFQGE